MSDRPAGQSGDRVLSALQGWLHGEKRGEVARLLGDGISNLRYRLWRLKGGRHFGER